MSIERLGAVGLLCRASPLVRAVSHGRRVWRGEGVVGGSPPWGLLVPCSRVAAGRVRRGATAVGGVASLMPLRAVLLPAAIRTVSTHDLMIDIEPEHARCACD